MTVFPVRFYVLLLLESFLISEVLNSSMHVVVIQYLLADHK